MCYASLGWCYHQRGQKSDDLYLRNGSTTDGVAGEVTIDASICETASAGFSINVRAGDVGIANADSVDVYYMTKR